MKNIGKFLNDFDFGFRGDFFLVSRFSKNIRNLFNEIRAATYFNVYLAWQFFSLSRKPLFEKVDDNEEDLV